MKSIDLRDYGATLLRVSLGVYYILHGYYEGVLVGVAGLVDANASLGVPFPALAAWAIVAGHLVGGLFLLIGFCARLGALANIFIMAGVVFVGRFHEGFFLHGVVREPPAPVAAAGYAYALFLLIATVVVLFLGSGALSVDSGVKPRR